MKKLLIFFGLLVLSMTGIAQSNVDLRGDSIRIYKNGGYAELVLRNKTKDTIGGFLQNMGNGRTEFHTVTQGGGGTSALPDADFFIGNNLGIATARTISGDWTNTNVGVVTNTGLLAHALPSLTPGYLNWSGSAWRLFNDSINLYTYPGATVNSLRNSNAGDSLYTFGQKDSTEIAHTKLGDSLIREYLVPTSAVDATYILPGGHIDNKGRWQTVTEHAGTLVASHNVVYNPSGLFATQPVPLHQSVDAATTAALGASTFNSGAGTLTSTTNLVLPAIDGVTLSAGQRVLVKNQASGAQNEIYTVTQVGSVSQPWILTWGSYSAQGDNMAAGTLVAVKAGTKNIGSLWMQITGGTITPGTTALVFQQQGTVTGNGLAGTLSYWGTDNTLYRVKGLTNDSTNGSLDIDASFTGMPGGLQILGNTAGGTMINLTANNNGFPRILMTNTNAGNAAASGFLFTNDLTHSFQAYEGSSTNGFVPDGFLIRNSGSGRSIINASQGSISVLIAGMTGSPVTDTPSIAITWDQYGTRFKNLTIPVLDSTNIKPIGVNSAGYVVKLPWSTYGTGGGGSGTVNTGTANQLAYYASSTNAVSTTSSIPNGITATTQSPLDASTKVATDAYVDAAAAIDDDMNVYHLMGSTLKFQSLGVKKGTAATNQSLANSQLRIIAVYVSSAQTLTGIDLDQQTAGNYTANNENRVGLYSVDLTTGAATLVASSASSGTTWTGSGAVRVAFSGTYSAAIGLYYIGLLYNESAQVTAPGFNGLAAAAISKSSSDFTHSMFLQGTISTQTTLASSFNSSSVTKSGSFIYAGVY
jgi:hypothetical protein